MKRFWIWIGIVLMILPLGCTAADIPDNLQIITEDYAPFNYLENGNLTGISVDMTEEIFKELGGNYPSESFRVLPWNEAYNLVRTTSDTVLLTTDRLPERENLFLWAGPIITMQQVLFTRSEQNKSANPDLGTLRIVVLSDDCAKSYAVAAGADGEKIVNVPLARDAVRMLEDGTVDAWAYNELAGNRAIEMYAKDPGMFGTMQDLGTSTFYLAFNPNTSTDLVDAVNASIQKFKQDRSKTGITRYEQIVAQYLPVQCADKSAEKSRVIELVNQTAAKMASDAQGTIAGILAGESPYRDLIDPDLYVFVFDTNVNLKANAVNPSIVGKNLTGMTDVYGNPFRDEMVQGAIQNGTGWVSYVYSNPVSLGLYHKMSYYQLVKGNDGVQYVVGCGRYLTCDEAQDNIKP